MSARNTSFYLETGIKGHRNPKKFACGGLVFRSDLILLKLPNVTEFCWLILSLFRQTSEPYSVKSLEKNKILFHHNTPGPLFRQISGPYSINLWRRITSYSVIIISEVLFCQNSGEEEYLIPWSLWSLILSKLWRRIRSYSVIIISGALFRQISWEE